jgi:uncharacterized membrane protein YgcG
MDSDRWAWVIRVGAALVGSFAVLRMSAVVATAQTFVYTVGEQTFSVPANVTGVHIVAVGAQAFRSGATFRSPSPVVGAPSRPPTCLCLLARQRCMSRSGASGTMHPALRRPEGASMGGGGADGGGGASDVRTVTCAPLRPSGGSSSSLASRLAVAAGAAGRATSQPAVTLATPTGRASPPR